MDEETAGDKIKISSKSESLSSQRSTASNGKNERQSLSPSLPMALNTPSKKYKGRLIFTFTLQQSHVVSKNKGKVYKCDICSSSYRHAFSLKRHFLRNHVNVKYISQSDINNCKININNKAILDEPVNFDSDERSSDSSSSAHEKAADEVACPNEEGVKMSGLYRCHLCKSLKFDTREEIRSHFQTHLNSTKSQFPCEKCSIVFSHKQALYRHLTSHSGGVSFPCTTCGKTFENKALYLKHAMTHTDGRTCKFCKKVLSTKANKSRHERIHQGLKPYPCKHCDKEFTQSGDLKKHVKKQHGILYVTCPICMNLFSCKSALNKHIADRHSSESTAKNHTNSSSKENESNLLGQKMSANVQPPRPEKTSKYQCTKCKKKFPLYLSMLHHRRRCHPSPNATQRVHKKIRYYTRRQSLYHKRNNSEISEEEFYGSLSNMVADNLLNYVDGKTSQLSLRQYNFSEPLDQSPPIPSHQWSTYNFPSSFDVEQALRVKGQEIKTAPLEPSGWDFLPNGLDYSKRNGIDYDSCDCDTSDSDVPSIRTYVDYKSINVEERKKLIGRVVKSVVLCCVCRESLPSHQAFLDHSSNNHPNVLNSCVEIESEKDALPVIPEELQRQFLSPVGVYFSCLVPPPAGEKAGAKCTKCQQTFSSNSDLHQHIVLCGGSDKATAAHVRKALTSWKIKRTMKSRFTGSCLERRLGKSKASNGSSGADSPPSTFRPGVGRPRNNSSVLCPHCKQYFRSRALLNSHSNHCYKVSAKSRYLKMNLKKVETAPKQQPPAAPKDVPSRKEEKKAAASEAGISTVFRQPESPVERLSPSLETLVNSIKEKLTADELSPSNPTFSWMEDDAFVVAPSTSSTATSEDTEKAEDLKQPTSVSAQTINGNKKKNTTPTPNAEDKDFEDKGAEMDATSGNKPYADKKNQVVSSENKDFPLPLKGTSGFIIKGVRKKPATVKYKPKANPYVKKRRKRKSKLTKAAFAASGASQSIRHRVESSMKSTSNGTEINEINFKPEVPSISGPALVIEETARPIKESIKSLPDAPVSATNNEAPGKSKDATAGSKVQKGSANSRNENTKRLRCPFCMFDFAYVTTFHRHVEICPEKKMKSELDTQEGNSPRLMFIPKKDEVEESMLHLLRHQSRQSKMMKEAKTDDSNDVKNFQTYTCDSCHKIFFSLFKLLQHRVVHKLQSNGEQNGPVTKGSNECKAITSDPAAECSPKTVPSIQVSTPPRRTSLPGPSATPACLPSSSSSSHESSTALCLEIPKSSTCLNHSSGPSSAPVSFEPCTSSSLPRISKSQSIGSLPEDQSQILPLTSKKLKFNTTASGEASACMKTDADPIEVKAEGLQSPVGNVATEFPKRKASETSTKSPSPKKRKKVKSIVVKKHGHLTKQQLLKKQALKMAPAKPEESSQPDSVETVVSPASAAKEESPAETKPAPKRVKSASPTSRPLADRTCTHCGKAFSSVGYLSRHVLLRHVQETRSPPAALKAKRALKKKLKKGRPLKRSALQRLCKKTIAGKL